MPRRAYNKLKGREHIQPPQVSKKKKKKLRAKKQVPKPEVRYPFNFKTIRPLLTGTALTAFSSFSPPLPRTATGRYIHFPYPSYDMANVQTTIDIRNSTTLSPETDNDTTSDKLREWTLQQALKINDLWKDRLIAAASGQFVEPTDEEIAELLDTNSMSRIYASIPDKESYSLHNNSDRPTIKELEARARKTVEILAKINNGTYTVAPNRLRKDSEGLIVVGDCVTCGEPVTLDDSGVDYKHSKDCSGDVRMYACNLCAKDASKHGYAMVAHPFTVYKMPEMKPAKVLGECKHCHGLLYRYKDRKHIYHTENQNMRCPDDTHYGEVGEKF